MALPGSMVYEQGAPLMLRRTKIRTTPWVARVAFMLLVYSVDMKVTPRPLSWITSLSQQSIGASAGPAGKVDFVQLTPPLVENSKWLKLPVASTCAPLLAAAGSARVLWLSVGGLRLF